MIAKASETSEFDYVIVGAGSAGCVLANRLSADGKNSVLLLEAGPKDTNIWIHVPLGYGKLFKEKTVNWMYQTEPEPGLGGRQVFQPRGKVLGGSSSINGLLYVRGQHEDYDRWRQHGNSGWGYDDVLPYFKKAENQQRGGDEYHGVGGPLPVSDLAPRRSAVGSLCRRGGRDRHALQSRFQRCDPGRRRIFPDHDAARPARQHGVGVSSSREEPRQSACRDFRAGAAHRVRGTTRAGRRIPAGRRAANRAGAQGNPGFRRRLQFAAIAATLRRRSGGAFEAHGIDVVLDAPGVGNDLQDHLQVRMVTRCAQRITLNDIVNHPVRRMMAGARYAAFRKGPLTIAAGTSGAFFKTNPRLATPDIQIHFLPFSTDKMGEKMHSFSGFTASVCQLRPESRGSLRIRSADPRRRRKSASIISLPKPIAPPSSRA